MNADELLAFRNIRENTLIQYIRGGDKLAKKLGVEKLSVEVIKNMFPKINSILDSSSLHQRKAIINLLLLVVSPEKHNPKDKMLHRELVTMLHIEDEKYQDERSKNIRNKKEEKNWLEWKDVLYIREKLEKKYLSSNRYEDLEALVIISLYTIQRPRRLEYADCMVIKEHEYITKTLLEKSNNIYLVVSKNMYFSFGSNATKTEMNKNYQIVSVKKPFENILRKYLLLNNSKYLISKKNGNKMSHAGLRGRLNKIFYPKLVSASMLRKIFISSIPSNTSWKKRQEIATEMGHSALTALKIYNKI